MHHKFSSLHEVPPSDDPNRPLSTWLSAARFYQQDFVSKISPVHKTKQWEQVSHTASKFSYWNNYQSLNGSCFYFYFIDRYISHCNLCSSFPLFGKLIDGTVWHVAVTVYKHFAEPAVYPQYPLLLLIVNHLEFALAVIHLSLLTDSQNITNSQVLSTLYDCQAILCTYHTACVYCIRSCFMSADRFTASELQSLLLELIIPFQIRNGRWYSCSHNPSATHYPL